ncbi:O-antigen ligase like membrane protein [Maribacter dokdonensis]|uniref:O-antigen ligase family protein n=1 Tax=Maribacter dokdonensis TaxID=320912 RepID=UPI001B17CF39|nr:O-antigen ligase family protein [Maribacter dokdonensis]CAG2534391.1 O-antigen ligase like membrane protein [Maribacter dokdonensis]
MGNKILKPTSKLLGFFIIFVIIFLNALGPYFKLQQVATFGLIPLLALFAFTFDIKNFKEGKKEFKFLVIILVLSITTIFYYKGFEQFSTNFFLLLGAVLSAYIVIGLTKDIDYSTYFHIGYIITILILFLIMILNGNIGINFATELDFRDRFLLNANSYSYYCVFANFSLFYLYLKKPKKSFLIFLVVLPLIFTIIAFTTESRAGLLLIILINIFFWFFVNKEQNKTIHKKIVRILFLILLFIFISIKFIEIYEGSRISRRVVQTSQRQDPREVLFYEGIEVFTDNPILGVGLGQFPFYSKFKQFTHNSYAEILAEQGVIGAIFLFALYFIPTLKSYTNYRANSSNPLLRCNLLFFIVFLIYNNAYVFYKFPFSMMYFFLIISIQTNYMSQKSDSISIQ